MRKPIATIKLGEGQINYAKLVVRKKKTGKNLTITAPMKRERDNPLTIDLSLNEAILLIKELAEAVGNWEGTDTALPDS